VADRSLKTLLGLVIACAFVTAQAVAQAPGELQLDRPAPFVGGGALTCSPSQTLVVPKAAAGRAKLKARLLNLLRESLYDDAKGIVNIAREKEIKKLASKLKSDRAD
jgi:hypothetical protein